MHKTLIEIGVVVYIFTAWIAYEIGNHQGFHEGVMDTLREFRAVPATEDTREEKHEA